MNDDAIREEIQATVTMHDGRALEVTARLCGTTEDGLRQYVAHAPATAAEVACIQAPFLPGRSVLQILLDVL